MGGGKFSWVKPDVLPVVGSVLVGCGFCVYSIGRNLIYNPEVHLNKVHRASAVVDDPEGTTLARGKAFKQADGTTSVYRSFAAGRKDTKIFPGGRPATSD